MVLSYFFLEVLVQALMLGLFLIRRKVNCTQRRRVLFTSEYYARYSGSLDWGRIFSRKNSATIFFDLLDRILSFLLQGVLLFCEFSLPIICIRSVYYHSSRPVRKQLFHVITINVETDFAFTDGYWTTGGNLQWNALRDGLFILGEHCLWLREGLDILRLLNTFETITSHRNVAPM